MTFSIAARDPETGAFGLAVTTSGLAVGSRCPHARAGVGAVMSQHRTDPRLGMLGLDLLARGMSAEETLAALVAGRADAAWREIAVVDNAGQTAAFHGSEIYSLHGNATRDGAIALGNILADEAVPGAILDGFFGTMADPLELRLVTALEAGLAAGGELGTLQTAALLIVRDDPFPWMDLRIDRSQAPLEDLRALAMAYAPAADGIRQTAVAPETVPNNAEMVRRHAALIAARS